MFHSVRVASISFEPRPFEVTANADRLERLFRQAAADGAQLAVAPEGSLDGYVVNYIINGSESAERMHKAAVPIDGSVMRRFRRLALDLKLSIAFGFAERVGSDVYNCAVFIDSDGRLRGKYHKMQLAEGYDPSWWWNRLGAHSRAFDTPFGRCGFLICNDRWNADLARIPVLDGAQYLLIPSYGSRAKEQDTAVISRARENGVPIVEANVGVTLIISKGEVVALSRKRTTVTHGTIDIPALPLEKSRDMQEQVFLQWRREEMKVRRDASLARAARGVPEQGLPHDTTGRPVEKDTVDGEMDQSA